MVRDGLGMTRTYCKPPHDCAMTTEHGIHTHFGKAMEEKRQKRQKRLAQAQRFWKQNPSSDFICHHPSSPPIARPPISSGDTSCLLLNDAMKMVSFCGNCTGLFPFVPFERLFVIVQFCVYPAQKDTHCHKIIQGASH